MTDAAGRTVLEADSGYDVAQAWWIFSARHDLEIRVTASSPDGATLGAYVIENAEAEGRRWVNVGRQKLGAWRQTLANDPREFVSRYVYTPPCRRAQIIFYRSNRKGTLRVHRVQVTPVRPVPATQRNAPR